MKKYKIDYSKMTSIVDVKTILKLLFPIITIPEELHEDPAVKSALFFLEEIKKPENE